MKKIKVLLLGTVISAVLAACGGGGGGDPTPATGTGETPNLVPALSLATQFAAAYDAQRATAVPATAASLYASLDGCYLDSGDTKASRIADFDQDAAVAISARQFDIGSARNNITVVNERNTTNADGTARREIDITYDIVYADGSKDFGTKHTLISGSSSGSCDTPQTGTEVRFLGNRRLVNVYMNGRNLRTAGYYQNNVTLPVTSVSTQLPYPTATSPGTTSTVYLIPAGSPFVNSPVVYRRDVLFGISDPSGKATYAIVTGPGPATTVSGVSTPFSVKMISPRVLRDNPLLVGIRGSFSNWKDNDSFRFCRNSANSPLNAAVANCAISGAAGNNYGQDRNPAILGATEAAADAGFDSLGFQVGNYTFAIYNDDGWATVNGQVGKTPIATYTARLEKLPYTFAEMGTTNTATDKFPRTTGASLSTADVAAALQLSIATPFTTSWLAPVVPDADIWRLTTAGEYYEGTRADYVSGSFFPAQRFFNATYPLGTALTGSGTVSAKPSSMLIKSFTEFSLTYSNRNGGRIISNTVFD